jgi:HlyD family secretion protein
MNRFNSLALMILLVTSMVAFPNSVQLKAQDKSDSKKAEKTDQDDKDADKKKKTETVTAELKPFIVYESFDGVFESTRVVEIKTNFDVWTDLKIKSVVEEGNVVSDRQELLQFDTDSIDKAVAEAEFEAKNAEFALETARLEMKQVNATTVLDQALAERSWKNTQEDNEYYKKTQLPERLKDIDYSEKTAGYFFEYSNDELDQLEKMYTEDELTEESEEIVLKRARRSVESAERSRDRTLLRTKRDREIEVAREKIQQEEKLKRGKITHEKSTITLPIKKQKTEIALAQAEFALKNKQKHLNEIRADQQKMTLKSPGKGILYFGRCVRGKWMGPTSSARRLERDKKLAANAVVMTIVDIDQMMIRANLEEAKLRSLVAGMRGKALVNATGDTTLAATIKSISRIPLDDGKFDCQIAFENPPVEKKIMPGMGCKLSFLIHDEKQALVVPKASVFSDDNDVTHYVYVMDNDKLKRKEVKVGHTSSTDTEILEGLAEGDKIAKAKP